MCLEDVIFLYSDEVFEFDGCECNKIIVYGVNDGLVF